MAKAYWENAESADYGFHYTSAAGLVGILTTGSLWMTDQRFMNDPNEGRYCASELDKLLQSREDLESPALLKDCVKLLRAHQDQEQRQRFVVCFSEKPASLSQFRAYGVYALAFNSKSLYDGLEGPGGLKGFIGIKVTYSADEKAQRVEQASKFACETETWARKTYGRSKLDEGLWKSALYNGLYQHFQFVELGLKAEAFEEEAESRIVLQVNEENSSSINCRESGGRIIPYVPVQFGSPTSETCPLTGVVCGPNTDHRAVEMLKARYAPHLKVTPSNFQLRT
jgi:hypothetical protein